MLISGEIKVSSVLRRGEIDVMNILLFSWRIGRILEKLWGKFEQRAIIDQEKTRRSMNINGIVEPYNTTGVLFISVDLRTKVLVPN